MPRIRTTPGSVKIRDERPRHWFWIENAAIDDYAAKVGPYAWTVYTYLVRRADQNGQCYPSYQTIAKDLGISRSAVYRAIKRLEEAGLIHAEARIDEESGDPTSHLYTVLGVFPGTTPGVTDTPGYSTTDTGVYSHVHPNNTQLTRPTEEERDPELERLWARTRGAFSDDELARTMDKLTPVSLVDGVLTLRAPHRQVERVCRQQQHRLRDRLAETLPVPVHDVVIRNGAG